MKRKRASRYPLRMGSDMKRLIDAGYKAKVLLRKEKGVEGKYSMNDFINECLWDQMRTDAARALLDIYDERIAPQEKEERLRVAREKARAMEELEEGEGWI